MRILRLLAAAKSSILRTFPLMGDARVPVVLKVGTVALGIAIVSPIDLFGDIPVLGMLDDAALLTLLCMAFVHLAGRHVLTVPVEMRRVTRSPGSSLATR